MAATLSISRQHRLIRRLLLAERTLTEWIESLSSVSSSSRSIPLASGHTRHGTLVDLLVEARQSLHRRVLELHPPPALAAQFLAAAGSTATSKAHAHRRLTARLCLRACRSCGRALGIAYRMAQAVADAATARVLYGAVRALEKQLWVLDPRAA